MHDLVDMSSSILLNGTTVYFAGLESKIVLCSQTLVQEARHMQMCALKVMFVIG